MAVVWELRILNKHKQLAILVICGLAAILYFLYAGRKSPNRGNQKLAEIQQLMAQVPVFPDFKEVGSNTKSTNRMVDVTKYYYSTARYDEVKTFYVAFFQRDGWIIAREEVFGEDSRELTFQKGDFSVSIFHSVGGASNYNYAIDFIWAAQ